MRITTAEIEIILDDLLEQKKHVTNVGEFVELVRLQGEWENHWFKIAQAEEDESLLNWLEGRW